MRITIILGALLLSTPAHALSTYDPTTMTCSQVKAAIRKEGQIMLRWQSTRVPGLTIYDRYVANRLFCRSDEQAEISPVPTGDGVSCGIRVCRPKFDFFD